MVSGPRPGVANPDQFGPEGVQRGRVSVEGSNQAIKRPPLTGTAHRQRAGG